MDVKSHLGKRKEGILNLYLPEDGQHKLFEPEGHMQHQSTSSTANSVRGYHPVDQLMDIKHFIGSDPGPPIFYASTSHAELGVYRENKMLAFMIQMGVVLEHEPVQYVTKRKNLVLKEGRLTRRGIICNCCQRTLTLSGFELHAGSKVRRPASRSFIKDGRSLSQCHDEAQELQKLVRKRIRNDIDKRVNTKEFNGATPKCQETQDIVDNNEQKISHIGYNTTEGVHISTEYPEVLSQRTQEEGETPTLSPDKDDAVCGVCSEPGDLICCDSCLASFHSACLGLEEIPKGDWHCSLCVCATCGMHKNDDNKVGYIKALIFDCEKCEQKCIATFLSSQ